MNDNNDPPIDLKRSIECLNKSRQSRRAAEAETFRRLAGAIQRADDTMAIAASSYGTLILGWDDEADCAVFVRLEDSFLPTSLVKEKLPTALESVGSSPGYFDVYGTLVEYLERAFPMGVLVDAEESESEDIVLTDSRAGHVKKACECRTLAHLCAKSLGDNLLRFDVDDFRSLPVHVRGQVYSYLVKSESISSAKLNYLLSEEQSRFNLGPACKFVKDSYLQMLVNAPKLTKLDVSNCTEVSREGWFAVDVLKHLQSFKADFSSFSDEACLHLPVSLVHVSLKACDISRSLLRMVERLNRLRSLDVSNCVRIPWSIMTLVLQAFYPCFETLQAAGSGNVSGTSRSSHVRQTAGCRCAECSNPLGNFFLLKEMDRASVPCYGTVYNLSECAWISDVAFGGAYFPRLEEVVFNDVELSRCDVFSFLHRCPSVRRVQLRLQATLDRFKNIFPHYSAAKLQRLALENVTLDAPGLQHLLATNPNLTDLSLVNIEKLAFISTLKVLYRSNITHRISRLSLGFAHAGTQHNFGKEVAMFQAYPRLTFLQINCPWLDSGCLEALIEPNGVFSMTELVIKSPKEEFLSLECLPWQNLTSLTLDSTSSAPWKLSTLFFEKAWPCLKRLEILGDDLDQLVTAESLAGRPAQSMSVKYVDLSRALKSVRYYLSSAATRTAILDWIAALFPKMVHLGMRHQFLAPLTGPDSLEAVKIRICKQDQLLVHGGGHVVSESCSACEKLIVADDDEMFTNFFELF